MNRQDLNSRNSISVSIANGATHPVWVGGDFIYIHAVSGVLTVSVNDGPFTPCVVGLRHSGVVGRSDIGWVKFKNETGGAVTLTAIFGKGEMDITGQASIANLPTEYPLPAAQVTSITPAAVAVTPGIARISSSVAYASKKSVTVIVVTAPCTINTVSVPEGVYTFSAPRVQDTVGTITVDATGGDAIVLTTA